MSEALFTRDGDLLVPSGHTRGPWHPEQQHGGAPAALLADAAVAAEGGEAMAVARLSYEFLGPVPLAPLRVAARVVKPGRRFQLVEGELSDADGRVLVRLRAVRLRRGDVPLPEIALPPAGPPGGIGPAAASPAPFPGEGDGFHRTGMELRLVSGGYGAPGPARVWFRLARPLIDNEPPSPVARVVAAADFGNGIANVVPFDTHLFVNTDLTVHLLRPPATDWVLLDARTEMDRSGVGLASSTLYDERGAIGLSAQTLFVEARA